MNKEENNKSREGITEPDEVYIHSINPPQWQSLPGQALTDSPSPDERLDEKYPNSPPLRRPKRNRRLR